LELIGGEWSGSHPGHALPQGKDPQYPLDRRLGGLQSHTECRGHKKNPLPLPSIKTWSYSPKSDTALTELPQIILPSHILPKKLRLKYIKTIILPVFLY
jgi:hypothetical protein